MKIQNAEMEFVAFDAQDVITTSSYWFKANEFTDDNYYFHDEYGHTSFLGTGRSIEISGVTLTKDDEGTAFQLVCKKDEGNIFYDEWGQAIVVANAVDKGEGTQIKTFDGIVRWIEQYRMQ